MAVPRDDGRGASAADERDARAADGEADRDACEAAEEGVDAHAAAQLCDAPAGSGGGRGDAAEAAGSQRPVDDGAVPAFESSLSGAASGPFGVADGEGGA